MQGPLVLNPHSGGLSCAQLMSPVSRVSSPEVLTLTLIYIYGSLTLFLPSQELILSRPASEIKRVQAEGLTT